MLDLEPIHVACITGENGHGKTALLDAITWALWGKARIKTQEDLIHQNAKNMRIELDFRVESQEYRVTRSHSRNNKQSKTELNLSILNNDQYISIMGNTIRDTESQIINLLHMDYDTFVSTSYLRQGNADNFSSARPTERKKILSEVLNLSYYENLSNIAKNIAKALQDDLKIDSAILESKKISINNKKTIESELTKCLSNIENLLPEEKVLTDKLSNLLITQKTIPAKISQKQSLLEIMSESNKEILGLLNENKQFENDISDLVNITSNADQIESNLESLNICREQLTEATKSLNILQKLELTQAELEKLIAIRSHELKSECETLQIELTHKIDPAIKEITLIKQKIREIINSTHINYQEMISLNPDKNDIQSSNTQLQHLEVSNISLRQMMEDTKQKFNMLNIANSICPLCAQVMDKDSELKIQSELESVGKSKQKEFIENASQIKKIRVEITKKQLVFTNKETELLSVKSKFETELAVLNNELSQLQNIASAKTITDRKLKNITNMIAKSDFAVEHQVKLHETQLKLQSLSLIPKIISGLEIKIKELLPNIELSSKIIHSSEKIILLKSRIESNNKLLGNKKKSNTKWASSIKIINGELHELNNNNDNLDDLTDELKSITEKLQGNISTRDMHTIQIKKILRTEKEIICHKKLLEGITNELDLYNELSVAFGRNGIQALLIERAVPQIQEISNDLIAKLSENKMSININITPNGRIDRLTGIPSEELNIDITDEVGTRRYETFSGGESFKIDFAIRIALSKLLATRSGAPLPILFIDEGFGSQDIKGQQTITEAIQTIRNDFEKIIVITHIDPMKDSFEEVIEVVKTAEGSTFQVM
jgi:exonuclease SbcC